MPGKSFGVLAVLEVVHLQFLNFYRECHPKSGINLVQVKAIVLNPAEVVKVERMKTVASYSGDASSH